MLSLCVLPVFALMTASGPAQLGAGLHHPQLLPALWLTLWTSSLSMCIAVVLGTPLAWWLSRDRKLHGWCRPWLSGRWCCAPAVMGLSLLLLFGGNRGWGEGWAPLECSFHSLALLWCLHSSRLGRHIMFSPRLRPCERCPPDHWRSHRRLVPVTCSNGVGSSFHKRWREWCLVPCCAGHDAGVCLASQFGATLVFAGSLQRLPAPSRWRFTLLLLVTSVCLLLWRRFMCLRLVRCCWHWVGCADRLVSLSLKKTALCIACSVALATKRRCLNCYAAFKFRCSRARFIFPRSSECREHLLLLPLLKDLEVSVCRIFSAGQIDKGVNVGVET